MINERSQPEPRSRVRGRGPVVAVLAGLLAFGVVGAAAASLGGLGGKNLGADDSVVASCDTDGVSIAYTNAYDATSGLYKVTSVTVSGIAATCSGQSMSVTLRDTANVSLGTGTAIVAGTSQAVAIAPTASAKLVTGAAVVITG